MTDTGGLGMQLFAQIADQIEKRSTARAENRATIMEGHMLTLVFKDDKISSCVVGSVVVDVMYYGAAERMAENSTGDHAVQPLAP